MGFIFKFFKELNSAENEKFISLALVLGLMAGFLPFFNIITFIILIIALFLRIPFGLFLASWGVFTFVGALLDPLFANVGYYVLTFKPLVPFFEFLYNLPLMRWSGYNNTVVMGGAIIGLIFAVIGYFVLNSSIKIYREKFFAFCAKFKILKWIVPQEAKKGKTVRVSAVIAFFVLAGAVAAVVMLFLDPVLKSATQFVLSKTLKKPVYIQEFKTSLTSGDLNITGLYIGNVKTDSVNMKVSTYYLLWKKFDIENLEVNNIHFQKSVKDLFKKDKQTKKTAAEDKRFNINLPKPDKVLAGYKLESVEKIKKLQKDYEDFVVLKNSIKKDLKRDKEKLAKINDEIKQLDKDIKKIKSLKDIKNIIKRVDNIKKDLKTISSDSKKYKSQLAELKDKILKDLDEIKKASKNDYKNVASKYDLIKRKKYLKFAESLLKPQIQEYIDKFYGYYTMVKPYFPKKEDDEVKRSKGMYIKYKDHIKYPDFVLQKANLSATTKKEKFRLKVSNITTDQVLLNKKAVLVLTSTSDYYKSAMLKGEYFKNYDLKYNIKKLSLESMNIEKLVFVKPVIDINGKGVVKAPKYGFDTKVYIKSSSLAYKGSKQINDLIKNIKELYFDVKVDGEGKKYSIKINSDLDNKLSKIMEEKINKQIAAYKKDLKKLLDEKIKKELKKTGYDQKQLKELDEIKDVDSALKILKDKLKKYSEDKLKEKLQKDLLKKSVNKYLKF